MQLECVLQCIRRCEGSSCLFYIWPGCLFASVDVAIKRGCAAQVVGGKKKVTVRIVFVHFLPVLSDSRVVLLVCLNLHFIIAHCVTEIGYTMCTFLQALTI